MPSEITALIPAAYDAIRRVAVPTDESGAIQPRIIPGVRSCISTFWALPPEC